MNVIITGGSSGIGLAIARFALADGHNVSIIARDRSRLEAASKELLSVTGLKVHCVCADVRDAGEIEAAIRNCEDHFGPCDLLVANAGVVEPALFAEMPASSFDRQVETNFLGAVNTIRAIFPAMQTRGKGSIMIVSSGAALIGLPGYTAYCASKAALAAFAESLRCEVKVDVTVSIAFPPDTDTPQLLAELPMRPAAAKVLMGKSPVWPVDIVAGQIYSAAKRGRKTVHFGWQLKALSLFGPFLKPLIYFVFSR